jgi:hypothetical protein
MTSPLCTQPIGSGTSRFYRLCATVLSTSSKRHQSSYRRSRQRSTIKPDPDFLPSKTEPHDHIIHNPPPSMPNVYHTPTMFLPPNDKRRLLQQSTENKKMAKTSAYTASGAPRLPPPVKKPQPTKYHLTEADLDEMRRLRAEDPMTWSVGKLATKFDCSPLFVSAATSGYAPGKKELQQQVTDIVKSQWGTKRRIAREDRALRRERWYKDE